MDATAIKALSPNVSANDITITLLDRIRSFAMPYGSLSCQTIRLRQRGELRTTPEGPWIPFTAEQTASACELDFRWQAKSRVCGFVPVTVVDEFIAKHGSLSVSLVGLIPIARSRGAAADKGEVIRAIAEMPCRPFGFSLRPDLIWEATDTWHLCAKFDNGQVQALVGFEIESDGRVLSAHASDRPRAVGKTAVDTRWSCVFGEYRLFDHILAPRAAEVSWDLPEGRFLYWRGEITELRLISD